MIAPDDVLVLSVTAFDSNSSHSFAHRGNVKAMRRLSHQ